MLIIILFSLITFLFVVVTPIYLNKNKNIRPTKNIFSSFVDNDHGYPWSLDRKRIQSYKKALENRKKVAKKK